VKLGVTIIIIGIFLLYPGRLALKKEIIINTDPTHVHKKTIAIIFAMSAIVFVFIGSVILLFKFIGY
jgi:hypothetical protein